MRPAADGNDCARPTRRGARSCIKNCGSTSRVSRYFGHLLRRKNATGWAHSKGEPTSIGQARRHLIDPFTQDGQISIEDAVVEWEQFDPHHLSVLRNRTGKLKKWQQTFPGGLCIR